MPNYWFLIIAMVSCSSRLLKILRDVPLQFNTLLKFNHLALTDNFELDRIAMVYISSLILVDWDFYIIGPYPYDKFSVIVGWGIV